MTGLSTDFRLPVACPTCGSHRMRVSQVRNPDDKVFCASCTRYVCLYHEACKVIDRGPGSESEALIEAAANRKG
ncbi:hypothetical protein C1H70_16470 [Halomonas urumqiensis]|uniref:Uncharacterized protein n=1 Tax=Halomonas urumqiensis TaxID=1684789 RepID=A0A2N7UD25_9GAMM|nr:hypothetical protein C1H70_16470 [Halomonas urumqiensis]PTB03499.1 hypothetical protein C6V82_03105 [Halomonas urumqiensis]GHE20313.1 hypothetical protein GCM10017767_08340 [Halomonas urumqiensis]